MAFNALRQNQNWRKPTPNLLPGKPACKVRSHSSNGQIVLLTLKLTAALLVAISLHVNARVFSQEKVTISEKNAPVKAILREIRRQTGYLYVFNDQWEQQSKKVTIDVKNASVEEVLEICFKDQPFTFTIVNKTIIIKQKSIPEKKEFSEMIGGPPQEVRGVVRSESGEPMVGATVTIKRLNESVTTNEKGEFVLQNVPHGKYTVEISYVGYDKLTTDISMSNNVIRLSAELKHSSNSLDEMQVIAYGTTTQRLSTGDITTVKAADIEKQPISNPLLALEGRVPGLFITQSTGFSGGGVTALIQGQNSIGKGNDPFYVIDGVPYISQMLPNLGSVLGQSGVNLAQNGNPLNYINPSDIESISVLKDADATAIYGSRAANGAILITTKKGKSGQSKVEINFQQGWGGVKHKLNLLNTQQYLEMRHEAIQNDGLTVQPGDYDINGLWDTTRNTDWQKNLIGGASQYTNLTGTVSGGNSSTQYLVGATYHRETTVFPGDFADQKGNIHFNITNVSVNQKFRFELSGNYMVDNNRLPNNDLTHTAIILAPDAPNLYNADGSLNWEPNASGTSTFTPNPLAALYDTYKNKISNLVSNMVLSYNILPGLDFRTSLGYTNMQSNETITIPLISQAPENRPYAPRVGEYGNNNSNSWIIEPQVTYGRTIGKGKLNVLVGTSIQQNNGNGSQLAGIGFNSDQVIADIHSATTVISPSSIQSVYKYNAMFSRINYSWQDKYIMDLTARRDGSSRFGAENQFHNFGALGIGWVFTEESFFKNNLPFLGFGKLRASYGTIGNDQIGDYQYLNLYNPVIGQVPYQGATGLAPTGIPNPYLQWEETKKIDLGADLHFLKDRIVLTVNYNRNRSSNELLNYSLPSTAGSNVSAVNFPATVQNTGWEFILHSSNIKTNTFNWSTNLTLTIPQNKLIAFPNIASSNYANTLIVGKPITLNKVYHFLGVDPATGIYEFAGSHGTITSTPDTNQTNANILINTSPTFYGGFQNSFTYKGFELDIFFQFVKQKGQNYLFGNNPGSYYLNQPTTVLARWQKPGDITSHQRYSSDYSLSEQFGDAVASDEGFSDASYIRLKNLSLSWQLPETFRRKARLQSARLYVQGQNLITLTHYIGLDPETLNSSALPPLKILTMGIQVGW